MTEGLILAAFDVDSAAGGAVERIDVKDRAGNVVGHIEIGDDGNQVLRDSEDRVKGYYDSRGDYTRGADDRILAKGNKLRSLIC